MDSSKKIELTSTPKRRRLGLKRIIQPSQTVETDINYSTVSSNLTNGVKDNSVTCESPYLPCNQVEFLNDSGNNSTTSEIPGSPILQNTLNDYWRSLVVSKSKFNDFCDKEPKDLANQQGYKMNDGLQYNNGAKSFIDNIEESFNNINQSICNFNEALENSKNALFETKDSFLLDIKESGIVNDAPITNDKRCTYSKDVPGNSFYGLPLVTKALFKTYRNIEKFYDWQEECLNLNAIKQRRNLIYALPTSGGKTLVAEVLMLREVLNNKRNALFILPFVAIVQEKIWSLSSFAVQLDFLIEEYAGGKGHIPPKKRRKKNSIYIATIEKGLALIRSLIELDRLHEIGLIVVDELHLIGENGRGSTLETLLSTVIFTNLDIQIVGMSATIGNLEEIAQFLKAEVFQRDFRPVKLTEYVKLGAMLHRIVPGDVVEIVPDRELSYDYSAAAMSLDPDLLGGLVSEVVPGGSCLVFCPTKRNCENVASLLCKLQRREMSTHRAAERGELARALRAEGAGEAQARAVRAGVAFHHAGLAADERAMLEHAFRSGVVSVLCCTSTLAAGVNLPAQRVIVRAPAVGAAFLSLAAYRQMAGRAGRAGVTDTGESIIICSPRDWPRLKAMLRGGLPPARSVLRAGVEGLLLSAVALRLATTRPRLREFLQGTLMAITQDDCTDMSKVCDEALRALLRSGAIEVNETRSHDGSHLAAEDNTRTVYNDSQLIVSKLGRAAIKGCMELSVAKQLLADLELASRGLVLMGSLHLLYIVTPHDAAAVRPDYRHYYSLYCSLDDEGVQTAKILGITEMNAMKMITGKPIVNVPEIVLCRFYLALMLHDLWKQVPFVEVAYKYGVARGALQAALGAAAARAASAQRFCEELPRLWPFRQLLAALAPSLQHCAAPELHQLMDLPSVKKARAFQLFRAGYKRVEDVAKASAAELVHAVSHLSHTAADQLISAARMMLIEKVENLRAEAEDVMEELKI